jgi:hypothetical protein
MQEERLSELVVHPAYALRSNYTVAPTGRGRKRRRAQQAVSAPTAAAAAAAAVAGETVEELVYEDDPEPAAMAAAPAAFAPGLAPMAAAASAFVTHPAAGVPDVPHFAPAAAAAGDTGTLALVDEINRLRSENAQLQTSNTQLRQETAQLHDRLRMAQQLAGQYLTELNVARHQVSAPNKRQR